MSNETSEGHGHGLRLEWSTTGPDRYGMHDGVIYASCYGRRDGGAGLWVGDSDLPPRSDWRQAARDAEAMALNGAKARLAAARSLVLALGGEA